MKLLKIAITRQDELKRQYFAVLIKQCKSAIVRWGLRSQEICSYVTRVGFSKFRHILKGLKFPLRNFEDENTATYRRDGIQFLSETWSHKYECRIDLYRCENL